MANTNLEVLGEQCIDGGKCHHGCTEQCFRRKCCEPFSDYDGPWSYEESPEAKIARLEKELAEADRRAGAAERQLEYARDSISARNYWLSKAKSQWGVDGNISFDVVWDEALELKKKFGDK